MSNNGVAGIYLRLSRDDDMEGESNSIANQRKLLKKMAVDYGYTKTKEFVDDGITGTTFNRPGFRAMEKAILDSKIQAVIVKDMSRLGRDYLKVGYYTEEFFPEHDIRFIAVSDGFDSAEGDNDFIPFKNIMNEWYAKDTSKKLRTVWKLKGMAGEPLGPPVYGYRHSPDNKKLWIIDDEAAGVVRRIYSMTLDGIGPETIATKLTQEQILKPSVYCKTIGINKPTSSAYSNPYFWRTTTVVRILEAQEYCGDVLNFKTYSKSFKDKKRRNIDRENWVVFKDVHEPIIERSKWELVQAIRVKPKRRTSVTKRNIFSGMLRCADCGSNLNFHFNQGNHDITFYSCKGYTNDRKACPTTHYIRADFLETVVLSDIKRLVKYATQNETAFSELLRLNVSQDARYTQEARQQKLARFLQRDKELDTLFEKVYEDRASGVISEDRFIKMSDKYESEQKNVSAEIEKLTAEIERDESKADSVDEFMQIVRNCSDIRKLTTRILNLFVDVIVVHQSERSNGEYLQQIDIYYNHVGAITVPDVAELPAQRITLQTRKGVAINYSPVQHLKRAS